VASVLTSGALPPDSNGVYFVLTAPEVKLTGFCTSFCGFHGASSVTVAGVYVLQLAMFVACASRGVDALPRADDA
jgi:hypothetical protein